MLKDRFPTANIAQFTFKYLCFQDKVKYMLLDSSIWEVN